LLSQVVPDSLSKKKDALFDQRNDLTRVDSIPSDSSKYIIRSVSFTGNKQTKEFIMQRELVFNVGDTLTGKQFNVEALRSQQNLLNTALFNFVSISPSCLRDTSGSGCSSLSISINVKERWYTWPTPIFDVAEQNFNTWWRNGHNFNRASYGFFLWRYNFRGRKESIALICRFGYAQQFGGQYSIPFFNRKHTLGVTFTGTYTRSHEISFDTQNNLLVYFKNKNQFTRGETAASIMFSYRKGLYVKQTLDLRYSNLSITDTVLDFTTDYFVNGKNRMEYFSASYRFTCDYRDIKAYPLKGHFEEIEITKNGLGILADEELNMFYVTAGARGYKEIFPKVFLSGMIRGRWLPGKVPPYYHQRALGFSNFVRGYEYYVIDGQSYGIAKTALRYQILKPHTFKFNYLPIDKFNTFHLALYAGIFADAGYVEDRSSKTSDHNYLGNQFLFGYGAGIDLVTYYDIAIRIEYSFNKMGENGFFLHMGTAF
jgi:outer membrane protein assembly factor BamA